MFDKLIAFITSATAATAPMTSSSSAPSPKVKPPAAPAQKAEAKGPTAAASKPTSSTAKAPAVTKAVVANPANDAVDKVQAFYAGIKQVTAKFRQSVTNSTFGQSKDSDGKVWIRKPGKMRWDYFGKKKSEATSVKKSFISNGTNLFVVEHDNKQVLKKSLQQDLMPVAVSFLYGKGDLRTDFNAELDASKKYGKEKDIVLRLTPKKPSAQYQALILVVAPDNFRVTESVIIDSSNNSNHFRFFEPDFEKEQQDAWFEFDAKSVKNYRIVDGDNMDKEKATEGSGQGSSAASGAGAGSGKSK